MIISWIIHIVSYLLFFWLGVKYKKIIQLNGLIGGHVGIIFVMLIVIFIMGFANCCGLCKDLFG